MTTLVRTLTAEDYRTAFYAEQKREYPVVNAFEKKCGYAVDRLRLETAAAVLACPVKANPPNWQHGRVLYAIARRYINDAAVDNFNILDIGSAKGFSALCLEWALDDSTFPGQVTSIDVIDPNARVSRNTMAEVGGLLTLAQTIGWAGFWTSYGEEVRFLQSTGIDYLTAHPERIHVAFVDGKHDGHVVLKEGRLLTARQESGDLAIFDDVHIPDVSQAVNSLHLDYRLEYLELLPNRHYAIGVRK